MAETPKLKTTRVVVKYSADDGVSCESVYKGAPDMPHGGLISALEELARLTALFGFEDEALRVFNGARERVAAWKAAQHTEEGARHD